METEYFCLFATVLFILSYRVGVRFGKTQKLTPTPDEITKAIKKINKKLAVSIFSVLVVKCILSGVQVEHMIRLVKRISSHEENVKKENYNES